MTDLIQDRLAKAVKSSDRAYYRLVLVVGESGSGKTEVIRKYAHTLQSEIMNLNLILSEQLLGYTKKQRALRLPGLIEDLIESELSPIIFDNIELLFDINLQNDPLRVLQGLARNHTIIASWNGAVSNGKLNYAAPGHPEHRVYDTSDIIIVSLNG